ncbi:MAG TPA: hypothetical protein VK518_22405 [Puia sp.]|nr:hypothetical protein [Puia sp.]
MNLIAFAALVCVAIIIGLVKGLAKYRKAKSDLKSQDHLKETGKKISVSLEDCEIKSGQLSDVSEQDFFPTRVEILDSMHNTRTPKTNAITVYYLIYRQTRSGGDFRFISQPINMSIESLRLRMERQKQTDIYIDPINENKYYFDLSFLNGHYDE